MPAPDLRRIAAVLAVVPLVAAACSSGGDPDLGEAPGEIGLAVSSVTGTQDAVWGDGRALGVARAGDGTAAYVTTTGVHVARPGAPEVAVLDEFAGPIELGPIAIADDASVLAVATTSPPQLRRYDLAGGGTTAIADLPVDVSIRSIAIVPGSGEVLVNTASDPLAWDGVGQPRTLLDGTGGARIAVLPDGRLVAPLAGTAEVAVGVDATERRGLDLPDGATVRDAAAAPDGGLVGVSVGVGDDPFERDDSIVLLDGPELAQRGTIGVGRPIEPGSWTVTSFGVAVANGSTLSVWSPDGTSIAVAPSPSDRQIVAVVPASDRILTIHADGAIVGWGGDSWEPTVIDAGGTTVVGTALSPDGTTLTTVNLHGRVTTYDVPGQRPVDSSGRFERGETTSVAIDPDDDGIAVATSVGDVAVLDRALGESWSFEIGARGTRVDAVAFDPADGRLATGLAERVGDLAFDDTVTIWDPAERTSSFSVGGEAEDVAGCAAFSNRVHFTGDGSVLAVTSHDFSVSLVDTATGSVAATLPPAASTILDIALSPDDDLIVVSSDDATVRVFSLTDYTELASYPATMGGYQAMVVLPDSATMAVSDITGAIALVDLVTGEVLTTFTDDDFRSSTMAISPDGALLAAPTAGAGIGLWSTHSGRRLAVLTGHTATVTDLAFGPSGSWLASTSEDGTMRTWTLSVTADGATDGIAA